MAFTIELTIRGLCALVPSAPLQFDRSGKPTQQDQTIDSMTVLVLDAREAEILPPEPGKTDIPLEICAHLPLLGYPREGDGKVSNYLILDGHRIEITGETRQPLVIAPSFKDGVRMQDLVGLAEAGVDPELLSPGLVVGRLDLTAGTVSAFDATGFWEFEPQPLLGSYAGNFAAAARISIEIEGEKAELRAVRRDGFEALRQVLRPTEPQRPNQKVKLLISNLCLDDEDQEDRRVEGDFAVFYRILDNYNGILHVPHKPGGPNQGGQQPPETVQGEATGTPSCVFAAMAPRQ